MMLASLTSQITSFVGNHSVYAVFGLLAIDAVFPAASELVMVYGGALAGGAFAGQHVVLFGHRIASQPEAWAVIVVAGSLGYLIGSLVGWVIGARGGRRLIERHGRWFHLDENALRRADAWFERHGDRAVLLGRLTPVVRSFVSIPAGMGRMRLAPYLGFTALGSVVWCAALGGVGWGLGAGYRRFHQAFDYLSIAVVVAVVLLAVALLVRRRRRRATSAR